MKNEIVVTVQGHGTFIIAADKVGQLLGWLAANKAVGVNENNGNFSGQTLLRG